jgi:hypothetical protein
MGNHTVEASPQAYARIGGTLYLVIIVLGAVPRDSSQTNLLRRVTLQLQLIGVDPVRYEVAYSSRLSPG